MEHPLILVVSSPVTSVEQIVPVLELVKKTNRPFLLFCMDLQEEPMSTMIYNNQKGVMQTCAVNIPWSAGVEKETL